MTFTAITADRKMFTLCSPLSCCMEYEQGIPADALTAAFPYRSDIPQLAYIVVQKDKKPVFTGVIDEQRFLSVEGEGMVMLSARSLAALLLDNEAMPQNYNNPDAQTIFLRHIQPLGITQYSCEKKPRAASFTVDKGSTHWQVLESFCRVCLDSYPAVDETGRVCMCGRPGGENALLFANTGEGIRFTSETVQATVGSACKNICRRRLFDAGAKRRRPFRRRYKAAVFKCIGTVWEQCIGRR